MVGLNYLHIKVKLPIYTIINYVSSIHIYTAVAGKDSKMQIIHSDDDSIYRRSKN